MKKVLVTGAYGFIGKNLCAQLELTEDIDILRFGREDSREHLATLVKNADFIFHLAGVNRPKNEKNFSTDNQELTEYLVALLRDTRNKAPLLLTSSTQAELDNPYGISKLASENTVLGWSKESNNPVYIYRLPGIFGKWCKPDYNSVVATFCHNIANNLPIHVSDPNHIITLLYIDDVIRNFTEQLSGNVTRSDDNFYHINKSFDISLGDLRNRLTAIHSIRETLIVPNLEDNLNKYLYATYISYLSTTNFAYKLPKNIDDRGWLAEFVKSNQFGQIFISKTKPGISRGNHWHHTKIEKFLVVEGSAEITFRNKIDTQDIINYKVSGDELTVLDIPTGYVHAIKNIGHNDLTTIFWANEILDKTQPDTFYEVV